MCSKPKKTEDIKELCKETAQKLFNIATSEKLIFPIYSSGEIRISEQEARVLFCKTIECNSDYFYSVETPTKHKYKFSFINAKKKKEYCEEVDQGQSALIDLSLYKKNEDNFEQLYNIEFKANNVGKHNIHKDFIKLGHEEGTGVFFHILKNVNSGTLPSVLSKYKEYSSKTTKPIIFVVVILEAKKVYWLETCVNKIKKLPDMSTWEMILSSK